MHTSVNIGDPLLDMPFEKYLSRQTHEISEERVLEKAKQAARAKQFNYLNGEWVPNPYEGFAIISRLSDNASNKELTHRLKKIQEELNERLISPNVFFQLPAASFHQTIANCLSATRYEKHIVEKQLEKKYPDTIFQVFEQIDSHKNTEPIQMKMIGLSIFGTAIGMLGVFENEKDYARILDFRNSFYHNEHTKQLGIRMTRPFIGHITLTYMEGELSITEKENLANAVNLINDGLKKESNYFYISNTSLIRYHHLAAFFRDANFPITLL